MLLAVSNGGGSPTLAQGTSHACAFATAAAAHLLALEPNLTSAQVVQRLVADARAMPEVSSFARGGLLQWPTLARQHQLIK
jgi:subtilisin family serine protease